MRRSRRVNIAVLVALLLGVSAFLLRGFFPVALSRIYPTRFPPLPDLEGQPPVLADYIRKMNAKAFRAPMSEEAVGNLALSYQSNFFYDEAKVCNRRALDLNPRGWRWLYYSALIDEELGDTRATIEKLNRVLDMNPAVSQAWFRLGNSYLKTNSYKDAEKAFHKVLGLDEFIPETQSRAGLSNNGAFPLKAYASFNLARAAFLENKFDDAKTLLERLIEESPKFGPAYRLLGNVYQILGDKKKGTEFDTRAGDFESYIPPTDPLYDEMIVFSRNTGFLMKQFDLAVRSENYAWTLSLMNHLIAISPNDVEILTRRIKLALDMQHFSTVDSLLPSFYKACGPDEKKLIDMARYFVYRGQYEPAVNLLKRATMINPKATDAHMLFLDVLTEFKQYEMVINYGKEMISMDPGNAEIRNKLARVYIEQGDIREAMQQVKIAQQLSPDNEEKFAMLGRISKKVGSLESALDYYRKALKANPRNVNTQLEVGNYLVDARRWGEALTLFQNSLTTSPNDIDLLERYAWVLAVCPVADPGNGERALQLSIRLALRRKYTKAQEMRCGITLAAAYARVGRFDKALEVAREYIGWAKTMRDTSYLHRLEVMTQSFQNNRPYTL